MSQKSSNSTSFSSAAVKISKKNDLDPSSVLQLLADETEDTSTTRSPQLFFEQSPFHPSSFSQYFRAYSGSLKSQSLSPTSSHDVLSSPSEKMSSPSSKKSKLRQMLSDEVSKHSNLYAVDPQPSKSPCAKTKIKVKSDPSSQPKISLLRHSIRASPSKHKPLIKPGAVIKPSIFSRQGSRSDGDHSPVGKDEVDEILEPKEKVENKKEITKEEFKKFLDYLGEKKSPGKKKQDHERYFTTFSLDDLRDFIQGRNVEKE